VKRGVGRDGAWPRFIHKGASIAAALAILQQLSTSRYAAIGSIIL
jgi:hypothetical protein